MARQSFPPFLHPCIKSSHPFYLTPSPSPSQLHRSPPSARYGACSCCTQMPKGRPCAPYDSSRETSEMTVFVVALVEEPQRRSLLPSRSQGRHARYIHCHRPQVGLSRCSSLPILRVHLGCRAARPSRNVGQLRRRRWHSASVPHSCSVPRRLRSQSRAQGHSSRGLMEGRPHCHARRHGRVCCGYEIRGPAAACGSGGTQVSLCVFLTLSTSFSSLLAGFLLRRRPSSPKLLRTIFPSSSPTRSNHSTRALLLKSCSSVLCLIFHSSSNTSSLFPFVL